MLFDMISLRCHRMVVVLTPMWVINGGSTDGPGITFSSSNMIIDASDITGVLLQDASCIHTPLINLFLLFFSSVSLIHKSVITLSIKSYIHVFTHLPFWVTDLITPPSSWLLTTMFNKWNEKK